MSFVQRQLSAALGRLLAAYCSKMDKEHGFHGWREGDGPYQQAIKALAIEVADEYENDPHG